MSTDMTSRSPKILVGIDFDHTIVECNSDLRIKALIPENVQYPASIEALRKNENGWTEFMRQVFRFLHANGITRRDYYKCLASLMLVSGMQELLKAFEESREYEVVILSDSNSLFIERVLLEKGLRNAVSHIFTNPAQFDDVGCLSICEFQIQNECKMCTRNICKGSVLQKYVQDRKNDGNAFDKVFYIGDGMNDICPALKLGPGDVAYARSGYPMLKKLRRMPNDAIQAKVVAWKDAHDIKNELFPLQFTLSDLAPNLNIVGT